MPNNIDSRVVQMEFDNKQFEQGVQQSLKSLDALKKGLELDKAASSLTHLESIASKFDMSGIADSVDKIAGHFSYLGRHVDRIVDSITAKFSGMLRSVTLDQVSVGMGKYETQTKAVQTIMNATGKEIKDVESVLNDLMKYTDETSYDFSTMAESIGKFTSVGVDLAKAEKAMEGIANEAAMSGAGKAEANRAMYNFAQALSAGYVKLIDWKSIENANMATKTFKEELIKTAIETGKLNKVTDKSGKILKGTGKNAKTLTVDFKTFNETLSEGWLTSDVLIKTLERYADSTQGIGKEAYIAAQRALTFTDAMDAVKDAVSSGWMQSFKYMFGNLNEAMDLWTGFCNNIIEFTSIFSEARNEILGAWHEQGGYNAAIEAASNIWHVFMNVVNAAKDVFAEVFLPFSETPLADVGEQMAKATEHIRDLTEQWKKLLSYDGEEEIEITKDTVVDYAEEMAEALSKGMKGDQVKFLQERLIKAGYELKKFGADGIYGKETQNAVKALQHDLGIEETGLWDANTKQAVIAKKIFAEVEQKIETVTKKAGETYEVDETITKVEDLAKKLTSVYKIGDESKGVKALQEELARLGYLDPVVANGVFGSETEEAIKTLQRALGVKVTGAWDQATRNAAINAKTFEKTTTETRKVTKTVEETSETMDRLQRAIRGSFSGFHILSGFLGLIGKSFGHLVSLFAPVVDGFLSIAAVVGDCFDSLDVFITESGMFDSWFEVIKATLAPFGALLEKVGNGIKNFFGRHKDIKTFTDLFGALNVELGKSELWKSLYNLGSKIVSVVKKAYSALKKVFGTVKSFLASKITSVLSWISATLPKIINSITEFGTNTFNSIKNSEKLKKTWEGIKKFISGVGDTVRVVFGAIKERFSKVFNFSGSVDGGGITSVIDTLKAKFGELKEKVSNAFSGIKQRFEQFRKDHPIFDTFADKVGKAKESILDFFETIKTSFKNFFAFEDTEEPEIGPDGEIIQKSFIDQLKDRLGELQPIVDWFIDLKDKLVSAWNDLFAPNENGEEIPDGKGGFISVLDKVKEFFEKLKEFGYGKLIISAVGAFGAYMLYNTFKNVRSLSKGFENIGEAFRLKAGGLPKDQLGTTALKIAGAVGIIALSLGLMSLIDAEKAKAGLKVFAEALAGVVGAMIAVGQLAEEGSNLGYQVLALAGSVAVLALGLWLMTKVVQGTDLGTLAGSIAIIGGMLAALGYIEYQISKSGGNFSGGKGFSSVLQMCAGLLLVVIAFSKMVKIVDKFKDSPLVLLSAFGIIEVLLITLGAIEVGIAKYNKQSGGKIKVGGIIGMAAGLWIIVQAFSQVANLVKNAEGSSAWEAFAMIEVLLITVGGIAILISKFSGGAINSVAAAVPIVAMGWAMGEIVKAFGNAISMISGVNPEILSTFFVGVETAVGILAGIVIAFGNMPLQVLFGSLGLVAVMGALAAGVAIIAEVGKEVIEKFGDALYVIGSKLHDFDVFTSNIDIDHLTAICNALIGDIGVLVAGLAGLETDLAIDRATDLSTIAGQLALYSDTISGVSPMSFVSSKIAKQLVDDGKSIADTLGTITVSDQYENGVLERVGSQVSIYSDTIAGIDTTKSEDAKTLATDAKSVADTIGQITLAEGIDAILVGVGSALGLYYDSIKDIEPENVKTVDSSMISQAFTAISGAIPQDSIDQIKSFSVGGENSMIKVAIGIKSLGTALKSYSENIGGLETEKVNAANSVIETVNGIGTRLNDSGVNDISTSFTATNSDLTTFAENIVILGTAIGNYASHIGGIDPDNVSAANSVIDQVKNLEDSLKKVTWDDVLGFLKGKRESITSFGGDMVTLGIAIGNYATKIKGISWDGINKSSKVIDVVVDLQNRLPVTGQFWTFITGSKNMNDFSSNMSTLGDGLAGYANKVSAADFTNVDDSLGYVERLGDVFVKLDKHGGVVSWFGGDKDLSVLSKGMTKVGEDLVSFQGAVESFDVNSVQSAFDTIQKVIDMQNSIDWSTTNASGLESVGNSFRMMLNEIAAVTGEKAWKNNKATVLDAVKEVGESIVLNVSSGITSASDGDGSPKKAFNQLLADVEKAANALLKDNNSPFKTVGGSIAESLNEGINEKHRIPIASFANILASMLQAVYNSNTSFRNIGGNPVDYFASGISNRRRGPIDNFTGIITSMVNSGYNRNGDFYNLGKNFDNGLANGIYDQSWYPIDAFKSVVNRAFSAGKRAADSHSPSRKTMWLGEMMDLGLVVGLQNYSGKVDSASEAVINSAMSTAQMGLRAVASVLEGGVDDTITIRPVLDLSDIQAGASSIGGLFGSQTVGIRSANIAGRIAVTDSENAANATNDNSGLSDSILALNDRIDQLDYTISNMRVVTETGALVGQIAPAMDSALGRLQARARRNR